MDRPIPILLRTGRLLLLPGPMSAMKPVTLLLFASALHVSGLWLAGHAALADQLPADTTAIEALTVDQARSLAAGFAGVNAQVAIKGGRPVVRRNCLPLLLGASNS